MYKYIALSIMLFIAGTMILFIAYHNIDLSYNMKELNIIYDINPFGIIKSRELIHLQGLQGIIISFVMFFISEFIMLFLILQKIACAFRGTIRQRSNPISASATRKKV